LTALIGSITNAFKELLPLEKPEAGGPLQVLTARDVLLAGPARMLEGYEERVRETLEFVADRVPPGRRVPAPTSIVVPVLERLKHIEDGNPLKLMYVNLLACAIDRDRQDEAHPAFITVIEQLSRDEAVLMICLKQQNIQMTRRNGNYAPGRPSSGAAFYLPNIAPDVDPDDVPKGLVEFPRNMKMYLSHLLSLNVIKIRPPAKVDHAIEWLTWTVGPSEFGHVFISACVPDLPGKDAA
jgi:hypothetical protein